MVAPLLILSFVLVHLYDDFGPMEGASSCPPHQVLMRYAGGMFVLWLISHIAFMSAARRMDRGDRGAPFRADSILNATRVVAVGAFAYAIYQYGLPDAIRAYIGTPVLIDRVLCAMPLWIMIGAGWYSRYPVERRMREALLMREIHAGRSPETLPNRSGYVSLQIRHQMLMWILPICMISGAGDAVARVIENNPRIYDRIGATGSHLAQFAASFIMFMLAPFVIRRLWRTVELGAGDLRDRIRSVVDSHGVRVQGPFVWRTGSGVLNAAVLGVMFPIRYLLYTDSLLESLTPRELEAVSAHEVAHLKHHHMPWLAVVAFAAAGIGGIVAEIVERVHHSWYADAPLVTPDVFSHVSTIGVLLWVGLVFTYASRCFERQADAFAARHLSINGSEPSASITNEAAQSVSQALIAVAYHNGVHEDKFQWRHGSISDRRRRVLSLVGISNDRLPIDRVSLRLRWGSLIVVVSIIILGVLGV
ncbi:MAG: M48 family metallopeptidase [Phycisphaerales bacterium]